MPELPEVETIRRVCGEVLTDARVQSVKVIGINTLKSFDPPVSSLQGAAVAGAGRRGKHLFLLFDNDLSLLVHLMSRGRVRVGETPETAAGRSARLSLEFHEGRRFLLSEPGSRQSSWVKLMPAAQLDAEETLASLGPDAWPDPPDFKPLVNQPRPLHTLLRDQRVIAGIGRSWVDEILHAAALSPFQRGDSLTQAEADRLRATAIEVFSGALDHYERTVRAPLPERFPMPLKVHRRSGSPCPRCGSRMEAVHFEDHEMSYCPACQTGGRLLKDRRLSRLLK